MKVKDLIEQLQRAIERNPEVADAKVRCWEGTVQKTEYGELFEVATDGANEQRPVRIYYSR